MSLLCCKDGCEECKRGEYKEDIKIKHSYYYESGIDPIGVGEKIFTKDEMNGFYKMNILKYSMRAGKKDGNTVKDDMEKIEFYRKKLEENNRWNLR